VSGSWRTATTALALIVACAVHVALGGSLHFAGCRPNLAVASLLVVCLFAGPCGAAGWGLLVGTFEAAYAADLAGSYMVSRTLIASVVGSLEARVFRDSALVAIGVGLLGTLAVESVFAVFAPPSDGLAWLRRIAGTACANGALAPILYYSLRPLASRRPDL